MVGSFLAIPFILLATSASTFETAMTMHIASFLCAECWIGAVMFVLSQEVPPHVRGTATAMISFLTLFGNASPLLIGALTAGNLPLQQALSSVVVGSYGLAGLLFYAASTALWSKPTSTAK